MGASATSPGTILGTVGYMSPEQVRGLPIDHRTDIFSFGVVLYEMLTGLRPFRGDSHVETMNAILKEDPPELTTSGANVPMALDRIVRRCLEKNPEERFHSAHDLGLALETLSATSTPGGSSPSLGVASVAPARRRKNSLLGLGASLLVVAAFFAGRQLSVPPVQGAPDFHRLTFRHGYVSSARYAGDGKTIVYGANWEGEPHRLYQTRPESPDSLALAFPDADIASISSSGELALVLNRKVLRGFARTGTLARASLSGGASRPVLEDVQDADWLPDGSGLVVAHYVDRRYHLEFPVGKIVYETSGYVSDVRVSPDGSLVAFLDHPIFGDDRGSVAVVDRSGKKRTLTHEYSSTQGLAWAKDGSEVWFTGSGEGSARALHAVSLKGVLRTILRAPGSLRLADIGADGSTLLWQENVRIGLTGRARGETRDRDLSWFDWSNAPKLSSDGKVFIFSEQGDGGGPEYSVYLRDMDGSPAVRLGPGNGLALSPDGKWVATQRLNPPPAQIVLLPTGVGDVRQVTSDAISHENAWFTADGTRLVFLGFAPDRPSRLYVQSLSGGAPTPITPEGIGGVPSPDGTLVAFKENFYPADGGAPQAIPGIDPDDRIVGFALEPRSLILSHKQGVDDWQVLKLDAAGHRTVLHQIVHVSSTSGGQNFTVTPDGSAYVMTYAVNQADLFRVTGLK
jgi:Tol biopolymer transport system component